MKNANFKNKERFDMTVLDISRIQVEVENLLTKCGRSTAPADSVANKIETIAVQLLAAIDKIIDLGQDLNSLTCCMCGVAEESEADGDPSELVSHILAWSNWTDDLASDVLGTGDSLISATNDLIGSSRSEKKPSLASAIARGAKGGS